MERIAFADGIINDNFIFGHQTGYRKPEVLKKNTVDNFVKYNIAQIDNYVNMLHHDAELEKQYPLIRTKFFMPVYGLADNEVFKYSMIVWNKYMYDSIKYPYDLDGIIYQPLNQEYIASLKESKYIDYKWKPQEKNTIDFYIRFEKDRTTGKIVNVFDNSNDEKVKNKPYRICYLYNGKKTREGEVPVFFNEDKKLYIAHLFLEDGNVKDMNGNIIQDNTVVEFAYNDSLEVDEKFRWKPLRTRYDKTEMVNKYGIKYGNNTDIAVRIWRSITIPVRISDLASLSDDETYTSHLNDMRKKITHEMVVSIAKENAYYQFKTNLAKPMRNFHNWMKSILIYTYMHYNYDVGKPLSILDVGCGRGGDMLKFYHAEAAQVVGIEPDYENLHNASDGAISRYSELSHRYPKFPKMSFICSDFTIPLNSESQFKVITDKSQTNKDLIDRFFPPKNMKQFDRVNIQFAFHYFLTNEKTWKNTCDNINMCLRPGGYLVITTFDATELMNAFGKNNKYTTYYTMNGEKKILMDIVKKFQNKQSNGLGIAIDVYNAMISNEDTYITEYLVEKNFVINELKQKCNLDLIDTDLFDRQFKIHKASLECGAMYDRKEETQKFFKSVLEFYDQNNELNQECFKISKLYRYYCFRKSDK
jgi:SAM-dependent methyltransferase